MNPADYGIPPGDYDVSVVTNTGEEEVPIEVSGEVEDVRIPLDGSSPVLNVAGVGEVPFTMISQFGVPDATVMWPDFVGRIRRSRRIRQNNEHAVKI